MPAAALGLGLPQTRQFLLRARIRAGFFGRPLINTVAWRRARPPPLDRRPSTADSVEPVSTFGTSERGDYSASAKTMAANTIASLPAAQPARHQPPSALSAIRWNGGVQQRVESRLVGPIAQRLVQIVPRLHRTHHIALRALGADGVIDPRGRQAHRPESR